MSLGISDNSKFYYVWIPCFDVHVMYCSLDRYVIEIVILQIPIYTPTTVFVVRYIKVYRASFVWICVVSVLLHIVRQHWRIEWIYTYLYRLYVRHSHALCEFVVCANVNKTFHSNLLCTLQSWWYCIAKLLNTHTSHNRYAHHRWWRRRSTAKCLFHLFC